MGRNIIVNVADHFGIKLGSWGKYSAEREAELAKMEPKRVLLLGALDKARGGINYQPYETLPEHVKDHVRLFVKQGGSRAKYVEIDPESTQISFSEGVAYLPIGVLGSGRLRPKSLRPNSIPQGQPATVPTVDVPPELKCAVCGGITTVCGGEHPEEIVGDPNFNDELAVELAIQYAEALPAEQRKAYLDVCEERIEQKLMPVAPVPLEAEPVVVAVVNEPVAEPEPEPVVVATVPAEADPLDEIVAGVKEHATKNYEKGWDVVVETMSDDQIKAAIGKVKTVKGAITKLQKNVVSFHKEKEANVEV